MCIRDSDDAKPEDWDALEWKNTKAIYAEMAADMVNHPPHYTGDIECIDALKSLLSTDEYLGWLRGNAIKYLWRLRAKDNPKQDADKAIFFIRKLIEVL